MTLVGESTPPTLVGDFRWFSHDRVFYFAAYGDDSRDAHVLRFDATQVIDNTKVCFWESGKIAAFLSLVDHAEVDDRDDYRIAW